MRLLDAGQTARTGADPNLIVGGAVIGEAPAGAVEPLTEEAAVAGVSMLDAAPAAGFGGVGLDTGILDSMVTLVDEHGDV